MASLAVSVIIPTYNRAHLLVRAIRSALAALSPGDEIVVADDGSTDETKAVVEGFGPPVRHLALAHGGAGAARNAGLEAARGPLVAYLDSDDEWHPDKVALQRGFLERRPDVLYACSDFGVRLEDGTELHRQLSRWLNPPRTLAEVFGAGRPYSSVAPLPAGRDDFPVYVGPMYREEMRNNFVAAFTFMTRKEEAGDSLWFADDIPNCEDWHAFGRVAKLGQGAVFDTETAWQNGHSGPRVTDSPLHMVAAGWLTTLERVWGSDPEFLAEHGEDYREAVSEAHLLRALSLARHGSVREAGRELRLTGGLPSAARILRRNRAAKRRLQAAEEA